MHFPALVTTVLVLAIPQTSTSAVPPVRDTTPAVWQIDAGHSDISFRIRHFMSRVRGTFNQWEGTITADTSRWDAASVNVSIQTASIDTRHDRRDSDLRSDNFFDAANHPSIIFQSTRVEAKGNELRIHGNLTIRGVTRPVVLEGRFLGSSSSPQGRARIGFEASTTINRTDFGVTWNRVVEGGGVMLGDEVEIDLAVEAVRQSGP
jgi:polyisoprenoid-binding protein YceI